MTDQAIAQEALLTMLKEDGKVVLYRPRLSRMIGTTSAILLQQMYYRYNGKPFYKLKAPCSSRLYTVGDSWCEELGFLSGEFDTALRRISRKCTKGKNKTELLAMCPDVPQPVTTETKKQYMKRLAVVMKYLIIYWTDSDHITWYSLNRELFAKLLIAIYIDKLDCAIHGLNGESQFIFIIDSKNTNKEKDSVVTKSSDDVDTDSCNCCDGIATQEKYGKPLCDFCFVIMCGMETPVDAEGIEWAMNEVKRLRLTPAILDDSGRDDKGHQYRICVVCQGNYTTESTMIEYDYRLMVYICYLCSEWIDNDCPGADESPVTEQLTAQQAAVLEAVAENTGLLTAQQALADKLVEIGYLSKHRYHSVSKQHMHYWQLTPAGSTALEEYQAQQKSDNAKVIPGAIFDCPGCTSKIWCGNGYQQTDGRMLCKDCDVKRRHTPAVVDMSAQSCEAQQVTEDVPAPQAKAKTLTPHTLMKNALVSAMGYTQDEVTCWGEYNSASKKLRKANVAIEEVPALYTFSCQLAARGNYKFKSPMQLAKDLPEYRKQQRQLKAQDVSAEDDKSQPLSATDGVIRSNEL